MKLIINTILLFIVIQSNPALSSPIDEELKTKHPSFVTFNEKYYDDNGFKTRYFDKVGALSGKIVNIEKGPNDRLIFQLALDKVGNTVWVGLLAEVSEQQLAPGADIAMLGFFDESEKEPEFIAKLSDSKEYLLGFCVIEKMVGLPIFYDKMLSKCMDWESGNFNFN